MVEIFRILPILRTSITFDFSNFKVSLFFFKGSLLKYNLITFTNFKCMM